MAIFSGALWLPLDLLNLFLHACPRPHQFFKLTSQILYAPPRIILRLTCRVGRCAVFGAFPNF